MPIMMPTDTRAVLGADAAECKSRSLFMSRFAYPEAKDSGNDHPRRDWFNNLCGKPVWPVAAGSRLSWIAQTASNGKGQTLFAQLQSRLMVNMAGGVMENAGLCLDRFGLPYIPGSAVKGCARRMAIQELLEARQSGKLAGELAGLLAKIALVFGWGEQDWNSRTQKGRFNSDFAYAVGADLWEEVSAAARGLLPKTDHFAGSVSFLPAYPMDLGKAGPEAGLPVKLPTLGKLELDVVTCHHGNYYAAPDPNLKASDTEEPVPVVFPAIAPGHVFSFAILPLRNCDSDTLSRAHAWLATSLPTFGIGAKTAAGYGWFEDVTLHVRQAYEAQQSARTVKEQQLKEQKEREVARKNLQPDLDLIKKLRGLAEPDLRSQINQFATEERFWTQKDERVQMTLLHFFCVAAPDLLSVDRVKPSSKIAKAITQLSTKFPHVVPAKP